MELHEEILQTLDRLRELRKRRGDLTTAREQLAQQEARLEGLEEMLRKEGADAARLEGMSLAALFQAIMGRREQMLEKERAEYLAAWLKFNEAKQTAADLARQVRDLEGQVAGLEELEAGYDRLLARREEELLGSGGIVAARLARLGDELAGARGDLRELQEAREAAQEVLLGLREIIEALRSAGNWGAWDILGGRILATALKHDKLDDARTAVQRVQTALHRLERELGDVQAADGSLRVDLSDFSTFADYFFDGLVIDWLVQAKIEESLGRVEELDARLRRITRDLETRIEAASCTVASRTAERERLLAEEGQ